LDEIDKILGWPLFSIGDTQTTAGSLLVVIVVIIATLLLAHLVRKAVQGFFLRSDEQDGPASRVFAIVAQLIVLVIGFELALHLLGIHLTTLFAASGVFAIVASLAAKDIAVNLLAGATIRAEKSIQSGDLVIVDGHWLIIAHLGARMITANAPDGQEVLIPNSMVSQSMIMNLTRGNRMHRIQVKVGVAYESDLTLVRKTLEDMIEKLEWRSQAKQPAVFLEEFGRFSVNYSIDVWIDDANDSHARFSDLCEAVWSVLKDKGIAIAHS
jgi:potassium efflux system protein